MLVPPPDLDALLLVERIATGWTLIMTAGEFLAAGTDEYRIITACGEGEESDA